ncbi:C4-dicarboxylate ABC transporter [Clostridium novyi A str. 4552]|uniref:C4-dicarboxylate ABC transporter n=1 Tax=Clostridium novyi A str. 4552 TaxID=1444289 RepID=A0A0A0IAP1_CLONO|nr:TRAP transporter large permease [Clostridium novyi]KGM98007.1 C4-dicarboxylate ABC transporter [Clostridium novyi A str. 4552]
MSMIILFIVFLVFTLIGMPIYAGLGISSILYLIVKDSSLLSMIPQRVWAGMDTYIMIALPLFILAGELMNVGGITKRIINFSLKIVRPIGGGLAEVGIVASMIMAGVSGSSVADTSAIGSVLIPSMVKKGFTPKYATGLITAASTMGIIIPPSIPMITFSMVSGVSVGKLFLAGAVPGIMIGILQMILVKVNKKKCKFTNLDKYETSEKGDAKSSREGMLALLMPLIIIVSITAGIATASESAGIAVVYTLIIGMFIFKELRVKQLPKILKSTVLITSTIMIIIGFSMIFGWIMAMEKLPENLAMFLLSLNLSKGWILLFLDVIILFLGTFLDVTPIIILLTPILMPIMQQFGVSNLQFGAILIVGSAIGLATPPLGMCLNAANKISKLPINEIVTSAAPFVACDLVVLLLVTYVPQVSLYLPNLLAK